MINKITIISLADISYFSYMLSLVKSSAIYFPSASIYAVLVNIDDEKTEILRKSHHNIHVENEYVNFKNDDEKKCYCTNRRAYLFKNLRKNTNGYLIWVDSDSIFRKNCDEFIDFVTSCELTMRPKNLKDGTFAAGLIGISDSKICSSFIYDYYSLVNAEKDWMSNQRNLNNVYKKYKDIIDFKPLPKKYCDVWLSDDGVIWSAKSKEKNNSLYLKEIRKYVDNI